MVQLKTVTLFCLLTIFEIVNGKLEMVVDDKYEICRKSGDPALFDISKVKLEQYNDTFTYVEGNYY